MAEETTSEKARKPRKTAEDREKELQAQIEQAQAKLTKLRQAKNAARDRKAEVVAKRVKAALLALDLEEVDPVKVEELIKQNADGLRKFLLS